MMQLPNISFGKGFVSSKIKSHGAPVYNINLSTGMPIVSQKKHIIGVKKSKGGTTRGSS